MRRALTCSGTVATALLVGMMCASPAFADGDGQINTSVGTTGPTTTLTVTAPGSAGEQTSYAGQAPAVYRAMLGSATANLQPPDPKDAAAAPAPGSDLYANGGMWAVNQCTQATQAQAQGLPCATAAPAAAAGKAAPQGAVFVSPALLGQQAVLQLTVPSAVPSVGPPPSANRWGMVAVGYPLWLSVGGPTTLTKTTLVQGFPVQLNAVRTGVDFSMGDGGSVSCVTSTPWAAGDTPGTPSPDCGYTYKVASETSADPHATYRVVATASWTVTWSVLGQSGTIPVQRAAGLDLPAGELQALITGR